MLRIVGDDANGKCITTYPTIFCRLEPMCRPGCRRNDADYGGGLLRLDQGHGRVATILGMHRGAAITNIIEHAFQPV